MSSKGTPMTSEAASRIQSSADTTNTNQDFKSRAQSAAAKNSTAADGGNKSGGGSKGGNKK